MARSNIRWTKVQQQEFNRAVRKYNKNIETLRRRYGKDIQIPNTLDADYEKRFIETRDDLSRFIKSLRRLDNPGAKKVEGDTIRYVNEEVKRSRKTVNRQAKSRQRAIESDIDKNLPEEDRAAARKRAKASGLIDGLKGEYGPRELNSLRREFTGGARGAGVWASNYLAALNKVLSFEGRPDVLEQVKQIVIRFMNQKPEAFAVIEFRNYYWLQNDYLYPDSPDKTPWDMRCNNVLTLWTALEEEFFNGGPTPAF